MFTARPDTLFGATWCWPPDTHWSTPCCTLAGRRGFRWTGGAAAPAAAVAATDNRSRQSDLERQENKTKTGVFPGTYAVNPTNGQHIPVFIADYVLVGYGTGAIMAVPGHDQRDWEFATEFGLPIVRGHLRRDISEAAYAGDGALVNSGYLDGLTVGDAKRVITRRFEADGRPRPHRVQAARLAVRPPTLLGVSRSHRLRRRWPGPPLPDSYAAGGTAGRADYSPVLFDPEDADSEPSPLNKATDWVHAELDLGDGPRLSPATPT